MKNAIRVLAIVALTAAIGFSMTGCSNPSNSPTNNSPDPKEEYSKLKEGLKNVTNDPPSNDKLTEVGIDETKFNSIISGDNCLGWEEGSIIIYWEGQDETKYNAMIGNFPTSDGWTQAGNYEDSERGIYSTRLKKDTNYATIDFLSDNLSKPLSGYYKGINMEFPAGFMRVEIGQPKQSSIGYYDYDAYWSIEPTFGKLTITNLNSYNNQYIRVWDKDGGDLWIGDNITIEKTDKEIATGPTSGKITSGKVELKVWQNTYGRGIARSFNYSGNDKLSFNIAIFEDGNLNWKYGTIEDVQFTNGVATYSSQIVVKGSWE